MCFQKLPASADNPLMILLPPFPTSKGLHDILSPHDNPGQPPYFKIYNLNSTCDLTCSQIPGVREWSLGDIIYLATLPREGSI